MRLIFISIFIMAGCAILYELLLASLLSFFLGATILYFSLSIGIFLFALGVGAWASKYIVKDLLQKFLTLEVVLGILGGFAISFVSLSYAFFFKRLEGIFAENQVEASLYSGGFEFLFLALSFLYLFGIGVLVGIELPIFTRLAREFSVLREAIAGVFFWDYLGALAGSVLFPWVLLPWLGFLRTGFLVGVLNISAAVVLSLAMREKSFAKNFSWPGMALLFLGTPALLLGFWFSPRMEGFFIQKIFDPSSVILNKTTPYQNIMVSKNPKGEITLFLNWEMQFRSGRLEKEYHETFARPVMEYLGEKAESILILGGGDGLLLREIWKYPSVTAVTLVDIDPEIISLAQNDPVFTDLNESSMSDPRLKVVNADAFKWLLRRGTEEKFDAVFIDFPDPTDDALRRLYSREFYLLVRKSIKAEGIVVVQADSLPSMSHEMTRKTIKSAGFRTLSIHAPEQDQRPENQGVFDAAFVAASPDPAAIDGLYANLRGSRFLAPYLDLGYSESAPVNSLFRPADFKYKRGMFSRMLFLRSI